MTRRSRLVSLAAFLLAVAFAPCGVIAADEPSFEKNVRPILMAKCGKCHAQKTRKGGLNLSTMAGVLRGGESGEPAVKAKSLEHSMLWEMIDSGEMPPKGQPALTVAEKKQIETWIRTGARSERSVEQKVTQHDVLPFLYTRCVVCHGRRRQEGGLDMRTVQSILKGGKSGPAIVPGKPDTSLLIQRVMAKDMPPPRDLIRAGVRPLEQPEVARLKQWIAQGAKEYDVKPDVQTAEPDTLVTDADRKFWSFQSPRKGSVPDSDSARPLQPIDAFLEQKRRQHGVTASVPAERVALIRRVAFDLTGLPPKWVNVERFRQDKSADWYGKVVDHYLKSPRYGEHWGRYWLDLSGYADSEGKRSADPIRQHAWRYRDYVVRAFNDDKPYNRFLLEQLAGDELYDFERAKKITRPMMDALVATGFLRMAPDGTGSDIVDTVDERFEVVADELQILGSSVLGLTLKCAQCHSHKYDPIPQRDYYRLVSTFSGAYDVYDWLKPTSVPGQSEQKSPNRRYLTRVTSDLRDSFEQARAELQPKIAAAQKPLTQKLQESRDKFLEEGLAKLPTEIRDDVRKAFRVPKAKRNEVQNYLFRRFKDRLQTTDKQLVRRFKDLSRLKKKVDAEVAKLKAGIPDEPLIRALWDRGEPSPTWLFRRGQFTTPGQLMGPGVISVLSDGKTPFKPVTNRPGSTGRRLAFARWLTDAKHPLVARVIVNRVWFHHFGRGIVESLGNFGRNGVPPTHPELLDWLAVSFMENGWSIKWLHRQIMNTEAYRQSSSAREDVQAKDPSNRWLTRMPLRRLSAESLRDSLLLVSGRLNETRFGQPDLVTVRADGLVTSNSTDKGWRRTIYVRQRRKELPTILEAFDLPQMNPNCVRRTNSMVAPQALHLLNNGMVRELSVAFARRIAKEVGDDPARQVAQVWQVALSRLPTEAEQRLGVESLERLRQQWEAGGPPQEDKPQQDKPKKEKQSGPQMSSKDRALASFCHVVMNSAAFLFVD